MRRTGVGLLVVAAVLLTACGARGAALRGSDPAAAPPTGAPLLDERDVPAATGLSATSSPDGTPSPTVTHPPRPAPSVPPVSEGRSAQGRFAAQLPGALAGYQYVNRTRNDCAQAAVATVRTIVGDWVAPDDGGTDRQAQLQAEAPPDVAGGVWGSSPRLVQQMLGSTRTVSGFTGLDAALSKGLPVVVLLDLGPLGRGSGAHWAVVVGLSEDSVQVTNLGGGLVDRAAFAKAWRGLVPSVAGMASRGLLPADTA